MHALDRFLSLSRGDVEAGEATLRLVAALVDAAPGVNSPAAQRQLRRWRSTSRGWSGWLADLGGGGGDGDDDDGGRKVEPSMATFVCYAVCSMTVTSVFAALLARLILAS